MKIDEERNILYALKENQKTKQTRVDVYDLGVFGTQFNKVTYLSTPELINGVLECTDKQLSEEEFRIVDLVPMPCSQSDDQHLMLLTSHGEIIRIEFGRQEIKIDENKIENEGLQSTELLGMRFSSRNWRVSAYSRLPDPEKVVKEAVFFERVFDNFYGDHMVELDLSFNLNI